MPALDTTEAGLTLTVLFCTVPTLATRSRCVSWVNRMQGDTGKFSLIGKEETELSKRPGGMTRTLGFSNRALGPLPNVPQILNRYSLFLLFGLLHNPFGDDMIGVFLETSLTTREFLEMPLCRFRTLLLEMLTKGRQACSVLLDSLAAERLSEAVGCQIDNAQVYAQGTTFGFIRGGSWHIKGHSKREGFITVEQICLSTDG